MSALLEFLHMGGHGLYVWISYGVFVLVVAYHVLSVRLGRRRFELEARARGLRGSSAPHGVGNGAVGDAEHDAVNAMPEQSQ